MGKYTTYKIKSGAADGSGDATANTANIVRGAIKAVYVKYDASSAAGTDVTLSDALGQTILSLANANTSGMFYPRRAAEDNTGTDLVYASSDVVPVEFMAMGYLTLTIADQTEGKAVEVYISVEEY